MVIMVEGTKMIVVVVVVVVMVLMGMMVMVVVVVVVRRIVGRVYVISVGPWISSSRHRGRSGFQRRDHFPATGREGWVTYGLDTLHVRHFVISAVRTSYAQQIAKKQNMSVKRKEN